MLLGVFGVSMIIVLLVIRNTLKRKTLAGENIGELMANRQNFLPQFYETFNLCIYLKEGIHQGFLPQII